MSESPSAKRKILLRPVNMTEATMEELQKAGLIRRISPHDTIEDAAKDALFVQNIYTASQVSGPHSLFVVSNNRITIESMETHQDNEDWLLIGPPDRKSMFLILSFLPGNELSRRIEEGTLSHEHLFTLQVEFNSSNLSLFTIKKDVPHTTVVQPDEGRPPSFFVSMSRNTLTQNIALGDYRLELSLEEDHSYR